MASRRQLQLLIPPQVKACTALHILTCPEESFSNYCMSRHPWITHLLSSVVVPARRTTPGRLPNPLGINRVCSLASSTDVSASKEMALGYECPVFARKFPKNTASVVYNLLKSCEHELCIANDGNCTDSIPEQSVRHNATSRVMLGMHEV